jgi:hypothetical protein
MSWKHTADRGIGRQPFLKLAAEGATTVAGVGTAAGHGNDRAYANSALAAVRQGTKQYHDVEAALDDGYVNTGDFVPNMGVHFVNLPLIEDPAVDPEQPEVLLYEPYEAGNGDMQYNLVAVEYFVVAAQVDETPMLFGQEFDGPMPGHGPNEPEHYDLHAWVWHANPDGVFAEFNPNVKE